MVVTLLLVIPRVEAENSNKALIERYLTLRGSAAERLIYLWPPPPSAEFYTEGKFLSAWIAGEPDPYLNDPVRDFFVAKRDQPLPASIRDRLEPIGDYGKFVLMRERPRQ